MCLYCFVATANEVSRLVLINENDMECQCNLQGIDVILPRLEHIEDTIFTAS